MARPDCSIPELHTNEMCRECQFPAVALCTPGGESRVEWCENGHVVVIDPNQRPAYTVVHDFHREEY